MKQDFSVIFEEEPKQWGLRGDPYLWQEMKEECAGKKFPYFEDAIVEYVSIKFQEVSGVPLTYDARPYVEKFAHGGMSSGHLCGVFWMGRGIAKLIENYRKASSTPNTKAVSVELKKISIIDVGTDAIVNAANEGLQAGGGVCGAIFKAAGKTELQQACDQIGYCATGDAVITDAFQLNAKYIIHAVGPRWSGGHSGERKLLRSAFYKSLNLARDYGCHSIGFPLISTGIFGYPVDLAWREAISACNHFAEKNPDVDMQIVFAIRDDNVLQQGKQILKDSDLCLVVQDNRS